MRCVAAASLASAFIALASAPSTWAQAPPQPSHGFVLSGYGTAGAAKTQAVPSSFAAQVAPILLFQFTERVLFEGELEFELEEGATKTGLEYANISYLATDYVTVTAGKFLLPFGVFSQRLHPTWINRFASNPPLYGHGAGISGFEPLLPILADIGVMASAIVPVGGAGRQLTLSTFITNGPMPEEAAMGMAEELPELGFGESVEDNNDSKLIGGRLGFVIAPRAEIDVSAMVADWGEAGTAPNVGKALGYWGLNAAAEFRVGRAEFRTEWMRLAVDMEEVDTLAMTSTLETVQRWGGYVQATYRLGAWEPVLRVGLVEPNEAEREERLTQYGFGLSYYITPSISVMAAFELNRDEFDAGADRRNNRALVHWAFGF